jgi:exonuclease SbcC
MDAFGCEYDLEFNSFLQTKSDQWPYEFWSGGEKTRINLAIQFAIFNLHQSIYESQCNVLVFDEVDGKLDTDGINGFVNLLYKDFIDSSNEGKPDTILVISHKNEMRDMFPTKMLVVKDGRVSRIEETN